MRYLSQQITFQEIPDEISLSFLITGCPLKCIGCHSSDSWNPAKGQVLDVGVLGNLIMKYREAITCVLFMGGEWHQEELLELLIFCGNQNLKIALYTGLDDVSPVLKNELTFLKTGSWNKNLGGLSSPNTNQKLMNLKTGKVMNFYFIAQGGQHGEAYGRSDQQENRIYKSLPAKT